MQSTAEDSAMDEGVKEEVHSRDTLCRVCACYTQLLIPIFDGEGLENNIPEKIGKHLPVKVTQSEILPTRICYQCASTLISWHDLTISCVEAEHKLKAFFGDEDINNSDIQMSPSRDYDADLCEELAPDSGLMCPQSFKADTINQDQPNSVEDSSKEGVESEVPKDGEKERCLEEVKLEGISQKLMCHICSIEFTDTSSFGKHNISVHGKLQNPLLRDDSLFSCHLCSDSFISEEQKTSHIQSVHFLIPMESNENVKPDISQNCQFCGRFFRHVSILNMHAVSCEKLKAKFDDSDNYCDYVTLDESIAFEELRTVSRGRKNQSKKCRAKRGGLTSYGSLKRSQISIQDKKGNSRSLAVSKQAENTSSEKRSRLSKSYKETRVSCAYCIKSFNRRFDAISHVRKSHRNKLEEFLTWLERRKLFLKEKLCSICDKTFASAQEATDHIQSCHNEENSIVWACELCSHRCSSESDLLKHIAAHSASEDGVLGSHDMAIEIPCSSQSFLESSAQILPLGNIGSDNLDLETNVNNYPETPCVSVTENLQQTDCTDINRASHVDIIKESGQMCIVVSVNEQIGTGSSPNESEIPMSVSLTDPTSLSIPGESQEEVVGSDILINSLISQEDSSTLKLMTEDGYGAVPANMTTDGELNMPFLFNIPIPSNSVAEVNIQKFPYGDSQDQSAIRLNCEVKHVRGVTVFKCGTCRWLLMSKTAVLAHSNRHLSVFRKFCHVCWKYCSNNFGCLKHTKNCHQNRKWYCCQRCQASFVRRKSLSNHKLRCFKQFICSICLSVSSCRQKAACHKLSHFIKKKVF